MEDSLQAVVACSYEARGGESGAHSPSAPSYPSNIYQDAVHWSDEVLLLDQVNCNPLVLLHLCCGHHVSKSKLLQAHRHMLFTGSGFSRKHLRKRFQRVRRDIYVSNVRRRRLRNDRSIQLM